MGGGGGGRGGARLVDERWTTGRQAGRQGQRQRMFAQHQSGLPRRDLELPSLLDVTRSSAWTEPACSAARVLPGQESGTETARNNGSSTCRRCRVCPRLAWLGLTCLGPWSTPLNGQLLLVVSFQHVQILFSEQQCVQACLKLTRMLLNSVFPALVMSFFAVVWCSFNTSFGYRMFGVVRSGNFSNSTKTKT